KLKFLRPRLREMHRQRFLGIPNRLQEARADLLRQQQLLRESYTDENKYRVDCSMASIERYAYGERRSCSKQSEE
ncbi:hypothetical protein Dimus_032160, partial [Dionaea muscipula]